MFNNYLETFIQVADAGSFSKAANILFISPTAVIKQINILESSLNLQLFIRNNRGVRLTAPGNSLYKDTKYILQYYKESVVRARNVSPLLENIIRIGTSLMTPSQFLIELCSKIQIPHLELKFQLVPFENTPENAREILKQLGHNIDLVAGIFDENIAHTRGCAGLVLYQEPICCAVSRHHRLAKKKYLNIEDLFGENLMLIERGWNCYADVLRDDIINKYPEINIIDFPFYNMNIFNQCEHSNNILIAIAKWEQVHPLIKILPVKWNYVFPFGLLHSLTPSKNVRIFIDAVEKVFRQK